MSQSSYVHNAQQLKQLMQQAGLSSLKQLRDLSGLSELQLIRVQYGLLPKMSVETLLKLANALQVTPDRLLAQFNLQSVPDTSHSEATVSSLKQEYQRLQQQLQQQQETLSQEFQQSSLQALETWLVQWPTAAAAAAANPDLPALRLLPLIKPVERLLQQWDVEKIASVGEVVAYDPQQHQLIEGAAEAGDRVEVRYVGYCQGDKLLYRAQVKPIAEG